ncbi:MAG: hypothetical protein L6R42_002422 [Xanthoria sp. 1 TBL-2021]|nr:MAG: hypothetical protein L6R42_002422 [Xanthoria sp. 1 TBL-2021]
MNLVESQPTLQRRAERFRPGDCNGNQDVTNARNNAKDLARHAQGSGNAVLWELYFNDGDQRATISNAYQGVQNYDPASNKYSITEQCGFQNQDFDCRTNARIAAYAAGPFPDGSHIIIFSTFFALPKKLTCEFPSFAFHGMLDQGGTFLHELLHVESLAGVRINDGVNKCYSWECITKAAKPDNGGEDHPWYIAKSYEAYAYAARALGTRECNVDEAKVTAPYNGAQRAMSVILFFVLSGVHPDRTLTNNAVVPIPTTSASRGFNLASLTILPLLAPQPGKPTLPPEIGDITTVLADEVAKTSNFISEYYSEHIPIP